MDLDYGRSGSIDGLFVVSREDFDLAVKHNPNVYFGEVLGKHSEVCPDFNEIDFEVLSEEQDKIEWFEQAIGCSGYNPFDKLEENDWKDNLEELDEDEEE
jgi:hypothetical protein